MGIESLKEGSIGFCGSKSWISKIIRWFTKSRWSHTFIIWKIIKDEDRVYILVIEAGEFIVHIVPFSKYLSGDFYFEIYDITPITIKENEGIAEEKLLSKIGRLYGWLQLIGFGIVILLRKWFGWKLKRNIWKKGKICSEVVAEYLIDRGVDKESLCQSKDINLISPEDIYKFILLRNCKIICEKKVGIENKV